MDSIPAPASSGGGWRDRVFQRQNTVCVNKCKFACQGSGSIVVEYLLDCIPEAMRGVVREVLGEEPGSEVEQLLHAPHGPWTLIHHSVFADYKIRKYSASKRT